MQTVTETASGYAVSLDNVTFAPSSKGHKRVLDGLSLSIEPATTVALVGSNGAGKSTVLRAISGEILIDRGLVSIGGQSVDRPVNRIIDGVGVVHQRDEIDLIDHLTVAQNIALRQLLGGSLRRSALAPMSRRWRTRVAALLNEGGMRNVPDLDQIVGHLSGGMKQMLAVAIAVHLEHEENPCRLLLLDEHTSKLDRTNAARVMRYTIAQVASTQATCVMVTHKYDDAIAFADRIAVVADGQVAKVFTRDAWPTASDIDAVIDTAQGA